LQALKEVQPWQIILNPVVAELGIGNW
jgi:hypothetical protein